MTLDNGIKNIKADGHLMIAFEQNVLNAMFFGTPKRDYLKQWAS